MCRQRACDLVVQATQALVAAGGGVPAFEGAPWNNNTVPLIRASKAHLQLVLFQTFAASVAEMESEVRPQKVSPSALASALM